MKKPAYARMTPKFPEQMDCYSNLTKESIHFHKTPTNSTTMPCRRHRSKSFSFQSYIHTTPWMVLASLVLLLQGLLLVDAAAAQTKTAKMAALLPYDTSRLFSFQRVRPAIDIAIEKVTEPGGILYPNTLEIIYRDTNCTSGPAMNHSINLHYEDKADVFLGPVCDYPAAPVIRQCKYWDTPILTAVHARDFSSDKTTYPTITRISGNYVKLTEFLITILKYFKWQNFKTIYEPNGQDYIVEKMCHIAAESIHYAMSDITGKVTPYFKFITINEILSQLTTEIGTEQADGQSRLKDEGRSAL